MERIIKPETLKAELATRHLIDVRRAADRDASPEQLPGATWHDPEKLAEWADGLPRDKNIVLYCVRGGSVSNGVVDALQAKGLRASFIEGGIEGWKAAGGELVQKSHPTPAC
ncbi:MAG: sulfurtransferase [Betaproteobacteria bacterium]|nr:sulfurtransferase [Betaproteobacteria bacterium]